MIGTALAAAPGPPQTPLKFPLLPKQTTQGWFPSPVPIVLSDSTDHERLARREANHHHYQQHGNHQTWYYYVIFGFYQFDDVTQFEKAWKNLLDDDPIDLARFKIIWTEFHTLRMHNMTPNELLGQWATSYAKPYLQKYNKDYLLATEIEYNEHKQHQRTLIIDEDVIEWTEINRNPRRSKNQSPSPPPSPRTQESTKPDAATYYSPLQEPDEDTDVPMETDETANTPNEEIQIPPVTDKNQETPKSGNTNTTIKRKPIQLRNPYKRKNTPVNKKFARQLKHLMEARTPPDRNHEDGNNSLSTASDEFSATHQTNQATVDSPPPAPCKNPYDVPTTTTQRTISPSTNSLSNTTYKPPDPFILINDGTQRMTIRWKPEDFDQLAIDSSEFDKKLTTILNRIFDDHTAKTSLVKWGEQQSPTNTTVLEKVPPDKIRTYLSPKISTLQGTKTFIFGLRLCAPDNHYNLWISQASTRDVLRDLNMEITVSNSKSSSGNVVTAGYILMKHPTYTHRYFYLLSLRKALPENTPFFDLANHQRTPHGETIPHLVVKCGENHLTGLSEILSAYLDGHKRNTALFVASQAVKSMTQEEIIQMFHAHTHFIDSIQRLALYPKVVNIDRTRTERYTGGDISRTTREWARSLKTADGSISLRCDAENGGKDRRAYLLVPTQHLDVVKLALQQYLQALHMFSQPHEPNTQRQGGQSGDKEPTRPTEIYIPTPAVLNNLKFLNTLSSEEVWKCAPATIRTTHQPTNPLRPRTATEPPIIGTTNHSSIQHNTTPHTRTHQHTISPSPDQMTKVNATQNRLQKTPPASNTVNLDEFPPLHSATHPDDTTMGTTASTYSRTNHTHNQTHYNTRFQELESQIKQHQQEFTAIHTRFDSINEQLLRTMTIASDHSKQFTYLEQQVHTINDALKILLHRSEERSNMENRDTPLAPPAETQTVPRNLHQEDHHGHHGTTDHSSMSVASTSSQSRTSMESAPITSPEKKRIRPSTHHTSTIQTDEQEQSAQYEDSTPADVEL